MRSLVLLAAVVLSFVGWPRGSRFARFGAYRSAEDFPRQQRWGVWTDCAGKFHRRAETYPRATDCNRMVPFGFHLNVASAEAGATVTATFSNCGVGTMVSGPRFEWRARQPDGRFATVTPPGPAMLDGPPMRPGEVRDFSVQVPGGLPPGEYQAGGAGATWIGAFGIAVPFQVVP